MEDEDKNFPQLPFLQNYNFGPPEIEKILDTYVTKNNQRYYKVKWVKVCWVGEHELSYMGNVLDNFWVQYAQYMQENMLFESTFESPAEGITCGKGIVNESIGGEIITPPIDSILSDIKSKKVFDDCASDNDYISQFEEDEGGISETLDFETAEISTAVSPSLDDLSATIAESNCDNLPNVDIDVESTLMACSSCKTTFSSSKDLLDHQATSQCFGGGYKCSLCNVEFKQKGRFEKHLNTHKVKRCHICGKEYTRFAHLSTHLLIHGNIRPWSCKECNKCFTDKSSLKKHQLVHSGIRNHKCDVCNKSFQRAQHLRRHKEAHEGVKNFKCNICSRAFQLNNSLKVHMNTHVGEKPFKCDICWRPFADKYALKRHKLTHEKKKFICNSCNQEFSCKTTYKDHTCNKVNKHD